MRRRAALLACLLGVAGPAALLAGAGAGARAAGAARCGTVVVSPQRATTFYSVNAVSASGTSCTAARGLVRAWALAAARGQIPERVIAATGRGGVLVYGRPGPRYRFHGFTCRWTNTNPGHSSYLPGRGRCAAGAATVAWSYHGASNPTIGATHGCASVGWSHGGANAVRARGIACGAADRVVRAALGGGAIGHHGGGLYVRRRRVDGFVLHATGDHGRVIVAQRGAARITFALCWYGVDC